ncbi:histidinol phosphate phosphatase domain-containing protein [Desulfurivibrio dismutans]|uniref:histidinol phosphate phosphatase domain-containing protein n=1 Tax=Desulfurivibrio dismutans TaxID=1398908 RepID=UPI0023DC6A99|nr:histidinol phosphate phosphatase domain-containing protein [Desulfurivibrio alkaliphilus]MDF1615023.1 histidinol phosphate phosphatase domain-containing protein [Desulfurivibrio alkaliphilus]
MIDLHTHCLFSDGELVPAEHLRRVAVLGYQAVAITDHADSSNLDFIIPRLVQAADRLNPHSTARLIPGIELTHVPPAIFAQLTAQARKLGAQIVVGHGETVAEPVAPGTNRAAIEAEVDILAHPGLISREDAELAAEKGVFLELSGRKGHSLTNGHVAAMARQVGARLVINADAHGPGDFLTGAMAEIVGRGAGLSAEEYAQVRLNMEELAQKAASKDLTG